MVTCLLEHCAGYIGYIFCSFNELFHCFFFAIKDCSVTLSVPCRWYFRIYSNWWFFVNVKVHKTCCKIKDKALNPWFFHARNNHRKMLICQPLLHSRNKRPRKFRRTKWILRGQQSEAGSWKKIPIFGGGFHWCDEKSKSFEIGEWRTPQRDQILRQDLPVQWPQGKMWFLFLRILTLSYKFTQSGDRNF